MSSTTKDAEALARARFKSENPNMAIWNANERTDKFVSLEGGAPATRDYNKRGFKGTALNATYLVKRLTDAFGPIGFGWGIDIISSEYKQGGPLLAADGKTVIGHHVVHTLQIEFWYTHPNYPDRKARFPQFGQTDFVSSDKRGINTDEDAPKKSLTDAMSKAASWLGIGADIHLGLWEDNKYTNIVQEFAEQERSAIQRQIMLSKPYCFINQTGDVFEDASAKAWIEGWEKRIKALVATDNREVIRRAWIANMDAVASTRRHDPEAVAQVERLIQASEPPPIITDASPPPTETRPAAAELPQGYPPDPPETIPIVATDCVTEHQIPKNAKGNPAQDIWLAAWKRALGTIEALDHLKNWHEANARHLDLVGHYWPTVQELAQKAYDERVETLRKAPTGGAGK